MVAAVPFLGRFLDLITVWRSIESTSLDDKKVDALNRLHLDSEGLVVVGTDQSVAGQEVPAEVFGLAYSTAIKQLEHIFWIFDFAR